MRFLLLCLTYIISTTVYGQTDKVVLNLNFKTKEITPHVTQKEINKADYVQLKITNIPMSTYKVTINKTDSVISAGNAPALFSALTFGNGYTSLLANLSDYGVKIVGNIISGKGSDSSTLAVASNSGLGALPLAPNNLQLTPGTSDSKKAVGKAKEPVTMGKELKAILDMVKDGHSPNDLKDIFLSHIFQDNEHFQFYLHNAAKISKAKDLYNSDATIIAELDKLDKQKDILEDSFIDKKDAALLLQKMEKMRADLLEHYFEYKEKVVQKADKLMLDYRLNVVTTCADFQTQANAIITDKSKLIKALEQKYLTYFDSTLPQYDLIIKTVSLSKADSMIQKYRKEFYTIADKIDSAFGNTLIGNVCDQIKANSINEFISLPYSVNGDLVKLDIKIEPLEPTKNPQPYNTIINLPNKRSTFWGFSTGVYMSGLGKKAESWSWKTNIQQSSSNPPKYDTLNYSLTKEENGKTEIGISALLHVGCFIKKLPEVGIQFAFGPGLSMESKPKPRILIGAGLIIGKRNQLMITGGWIGGPVKVLSSAYDPAKVYPSAPNDITKDRFNKAGFVSLSYSIL